MPNRRFVARSTSVCIRRADHAPAHRRYTVLAIGAPHCGKMYVVALRGGGASSQSHVWAQRLKIVSGHRRVKWVRILYFLRSTGGRWRERRPAGVHINCVVCWSTETRNKREYQKEIECKSSEQTLTASRYLIRLLFDQVCEEHTQQPSPGSELTPDLRHSANSTCALISHTFYQSCKARDGPMEHIDLTDVETRDSADANPCGEQ